MLLITSEGKTFTVKYMQNKERLKFKLSTAAYEYPNWEGSKVYKNSSSSNIYTVTFAIHRTNLESLIESLKKVNVDNESVDVEVNGANYRGITNTVLIHDVWGELRGEFLGEISADTSSEADVECSGVFQVNTPDATASKTDIEQNNSDAIDDIDTETDEEIELVEADRSFLSNISDNLDELYDNIQHSEVTAAFNDLKSALNSTLLNYQKIMNKFKKVIELPGSVISGVRGRVDLFKKQSTAIKSIIPATVNQAKFNINLLSYNIGKSNRTPFIDKDELRQRSGLTVAPID